MVLMINARREAYGISDLETMTVGELIDLLEEYEPEDKIYLSHDNGYTYGGIRRERIEEVDEEDEEEDVL